MGCGHAAKIIFFRCYIKHDRVTQLGIIGYLLHFLIGNLVVFAFHLIHNDFAGQHPEALFVEV